MEAYVKKENYALRSVTAIMLFLIAYAHFFISVDYGYGYSKEFGDFIEILVGFGRFAIPIFFMISGYYLFSKDGHSEAHIGRKVLHILYLIILLKVSYLILVGIAYAQGMVSLDEFINSFVLIGFTSTAHIWFLYVLFLMYAFFWILHRYNVDFRKVYWIGWIPIAVVLISGNIIPLFLSVDAGNELRHLVADNAYPFIGYSFFVLGYYLHQNKERIDRDYSRSVLYILFVFGSLMAIFEVLVLPQRVLYFGSLIQAFGLFLITFKIAEDEFRCRPLEYIGRNLMPFFYVYMMAPVFVCITYLQPHISAFDFYIICPIACVIVTTLIALVFYLALRYILQKRSEKKASVA